MLVKQAQTELLTYCGHRGPYGSFLVLHVIPLVDRVLSNHSVRSTASQGRSSEPSLSHTRSHARIYLGSSQGPDVRIKTVNNGLPSEIPRSHPRSHPSHLHLKSSILYW